MYLIKFVYLGEGNRWQDEYQLVIVDNFEEACDRIKEVYSEANDFEDLTLL